MIKVVVIGGPILSGGKKNLIIEYFRHIACIFHTQ